MNDQPDKQRKQNWENEFRNYYEYLVTFLREKEILNEDASEKILNKIQKLKFECSKYFDEEHPVEEKVSRKEVFVTIMSSAKRISAMPDQPTPIVISFDNKGKVVGVHTLNAVHTNDSTRNFLGYFSTSTPPNDVTHVILGYCYIGGKRRCFLDCKRNSTKRILLLDQIIFYYNLCGIYLTPPPSL